MRGTAYAEMECFVAVARHGGFARAARALRLAPSTLSSAVSGLEGRLGVRLFNRTTRSVALTEAGERLLARVHPAIEEIATAIEVVNEFRDKPAGRLRLSVSTIPAQLMLAPLLGRFLAAYPAIDLDIVVSDDPHEDITKGRYDAGIRYGRWITQDMTVVRMLPNSRIITVAAPAYLAQRPSPAVPQDLVSHNCVRYRRSANEISRWYFKKGRKELDIDVRGNLTVNSVQLATWAVLDGVGIGYTVEAYVQAYLERGALVTVLEDWAPPWAGYFLYYTSHRPIPAPLRAFVDFLRSHRPDLTRAGSTDNV
ncbi:MAG TPA: LysR family transcriptional regulator [Steroidobacteraceae bacterium]|nr:LysR family transcriptional regulator [Steroidobacteraceae bacterium]